MTKNQVQPISQLLILKMLAIFFAGTTHCLLAYAETENTTPPNLGKLEEGNDTGITIRQKESEKRITEKRENGRVTEIKVNNGNGAPAYYLKPNTPAGSALPGDVQSNSIRAPQWEIMEFGGPKNQNTDEQTNHLIQTDPFPPGPPPAMLVPAPTSTDKK